MKWVRIVYYIVILFYLEFQLKKEEKWGDRMAWLKSKIVKYKEKLEVLL